jgi:PBSX family phage portal protein
MNIPATLKDFAVRAYQTMTTASRTETTDSGQSLAFSFGDPEPVLKDRLTDYLGVFVDVFYNYYLPPISLIGLANTENANPQHGAILRFKRNMLAKWFKPSYLLSYGEFRKAALDFQVFGMAYFQVIYNRLGGVLRLERRPALMMRRGVEPGVFYELRDYRFYGQPIEYRPGEIVCLMEDDVKQTIYGIPEYFGGLQSVLLSEDATLFRRKYFRNGSHVGYILVTSDAGLSAETAKQIEEEVKKSRGPGNFRSMYLNIPRTSSREPVKVIPVGDIATKDDFEKVKGITKGEILAMHRMQPGIAGIIPENMTGFGDLEKVMRVYCELEVPPMQQVFLALNDILPSSGRIAFDPPVWAGQA